MRDEVLGGLLLGDVFWEPYGDGEGVFGGVYVGEGKPVVGGEGIEGIVEDVGYGVSRDFSGGMGERRESERGGGECGERLDE